ncbi:MAG: hypothetical protein QM811_06310 [Pirellulales bacterium]
MSCCAQDKTSTLRAKRARELVKKLDSALFADREEAFRELSDQGLQIHPVLKKELAATASTETRERLRMLLAKVPQRHQNLFTPQALARMRWTRVMEMIDTPESRVLAAKLKWE